MKKVLIFIGCLLGLFILHTTSNAQTLVKIKKPGTLGNLQNEGVNAYDSLKIYAEAVSNYGKKYPQEIVFVHMDNTCYFLGDTLYYKAYVQRSDKGVPSNISQVLYAELFNQDGYLVERQTIRLKNGQGWGSFILADSLYAGFYELRAYTRWQLNWGVYEHQHTKYAEKWFLKEKMAKDFFRDYEKLYSRVFPLYDKPQKNEMPERIMTTRPLRRYYKLKAETPDAIVNLYPEGGDWIEGIPQRIAFEANDPEGKHLQGELVIYNSAKEPIAKGKTSHRGKGLLEITAKQNESYSAVFTWDKGETNKIKLPTIRSKGTVMRVDQRDNEFLIRVGKNGMDEIPLGLTIMNHGSLNHYQEVKGDSIIIDTDKLPEGIAQLTLYDAMGRIWADRMVFVSNGKSKNKDILIKGLPQKCTPFMPVNIKLEGEPNAEVSIAIRDEALADPVYDNGSLLTEMLLSSQIKGFVEDPRYYFEKDDDERRKALDLLLMVQGWRRYRWEDMKEKFTVREPFEISPVIRGDVHKYTPLDHENYFYVETMENPETMIKAQTTGGVSGPLIIEKLKIEQEHPFLEEVKDNDGIYNSKKNDPSNYQFLTEVGEELQVHAQFAQPVNVDNNSLLESVMTKNGEFAIQGPHADSPYFTYLNATKKGGIPELVTDAAEFPEYSVRVRPFHPRYVKPYNYYHMAIMPVKSENKSVQSTDNFFKIMDEVSVGAKRTGLRKIDLTKPAMEIDAYDAFNEMVDAGLSPAWYSGSLSFSIGLARLYIGEMGILRSYKLERRWDGKNMSNNISEKIQHKYNNLNQLLKVSIYTDYAPRMEGDEKYEASNQPEVSVNLQLIPDDGRRLAYRERRYIMTGYNVCEDFYMPNYEKKPLPEFRDYRRTIYWNPCLKTNELGIAEIKFYNNCRENQLSLSIEGIMPDGTILSGKSE